MRAMEKMSLTGNFIFRKRINELAPKEYINALKEIGILEKK